MEEMRENPTVENVWEHFWKGIVAKNGKLDIEQVKKELFDFYIMMDNVPYVYNVVTGGRFSKPLTPANVIIEEFESLFQPIDDDGE